MEIATPKMVSLNEINNWMIGKAKMEYILYCKDTYKPIEEKKPDDIFKE